MTLSYRDTVISKTPLAFFACDELSGTVMADSSGNGYDGVYNPGTLLGQASPIETDSTTHAIRGSGISTSAPLPLNAFSFGGWGLHDGGTPHSIIARSGQPGVGVGSNFIAIDSGSIVARLTINDVVGQFYDLSYALPVVNRFYRALVTRNTNVMRLYVNGVLRAERTDLVTGPITHPGVLASSWMIGISGNNNVFSGAGTCMDDIYDYALTAADELEIYEAALLTLLSSATIKVRVQVLLDTDAPEPVNFAFAHNWTEPISGSERVITEHLSWRTHANRSEPDYQQRINARPHGPRRSLEYAITPTSALAKAAFQRTLWQPAQTFRLPIWTDWTPLTATADATDTTLDCDTTLRDFEIGSYCAISNDPYDPPTFQFFKIASRSDTQLGVSPSVTTTITDGFIAPVRLACLPNEESQLESYVIDRETGTLTFEVLDTELSSRRVTAYAPVSTYQPNLSKPAVEVFSLDSTRFDVLEQAPYTVRQRQLGTGLLTGNDYYRGLDTATSSTIPVRVLLVSRETLSEFYGWLEARQGRQNPVWVPSGENDLTFVAHLGGGSVKIRSGYAFYNLHYGRRDIQITYADGTVQNVRITAVVDNNDGTETLTLAASVGATITKISWLRFCVAPDSFELRFHRDITIPGNMIVECAWEFTELLTTP